VSLCAVTAQLAIAYPQLNKSFSLEKWVEANYNINLFVVLSLNIWLAKYRVTATAMDIFHQILKVQKIGKLLTFLSECSMC